MLRKNRCQKLKKNEKKLGIEKETKKKFFLLHPTSCDQIESIINLKRRKGKRKMKLWTI